ncbi:MAG: hypothetical protein JST68_17235 [Bacteroidetes bacterium]|nr:hypothetical protein [Bacteroidota bacterium]
MKQLFIFLLLFSPVILFAQKETFDIVSFSPPSGWEKKYNNTSVVYSTTNKATRKWCQIAVYKSTASKGSIDADFESEWNQIVRPLGVTSFPQDAVAQDMGAWKIKSGSGNFPFNGDNATTSLTTISGNNVCVSVIGNTNTMDLFPRIQEFVSSLELSAPPQTADPSQTTVNQTTTSSQTTTPAQPPTAIADGYKYTSTNWPNGWVSTVESDWVEVAAGAIKVLIHYPKDGTITQLDPDPMVRKAWDILVAPRYKNLQNFKVVSPSLDWQRAYLGAANVTDATGQQRYVVLFRKNTGWMEYIAPDKASFVAQYGVDPDQTPSDAPGKIFEKMVDMAGYNRFAVDPSDLKGRWDDHYAANTYYANMYTGMSAGMSTYSSSQWFIFGEGASYEWHIVAANTYGGATNVAQAKSNGTFQSLSGWQLKFSDMEGKPKTYDCYFSVTKGSRVLWMNDAVHPGSGNFTGYSKKQ